MPIGTLCTVKKFAAPALLILMEVSRLEDNGNASAVYGDAPFVPWFLKHLEVHVPVTDKIHQPAGCAPRPVSLHPRCVRHINRL